MSKQFEQLVDKIPSIYKKKAYYPITEPCEINKDGNFDKYRGIPSISKSSLSTYDSVLSGFEEDDEEDKDYKEDVKGPKSSKFIKNYKKDQLFFFWPDCKCGRDMDFLFQLTNPHDDVTYQMFMCIDQSCRNKRINDQFIYKFDYDDNVNIRDIIDEKVILLSQVTGENVLAQLISSYKCYKVNRYSSYDEINWDAVRPWLLKSVKNGKISTWICKDNCSKKNENSSDFQCMCFYGCIYDNVHGDKFGGFGHSCQGLYYKKVIFSFSESDMIPYMWGDAGYANISKGLYGELRCDVDCS